MIVNGEFGRLWQETVVTYFKLVYKYLCRGAEQSHENLSED